MASTLVICHTRSEDGDELKRRLEGKRPAVFLDYDGTQTPIVDRAEEALISESMRDAVRELAALPRVRGQRARQAGWSRSSWA